jgi:hypothetical protein
MRLSRPALTSISLLLVTSCAGLPFFSWGKLNDSPTEESGSGHVQALLELQDIAFDGQIFSGRLLISPVGGNLHVDKRMIESFALSVKNVSACDTGQPLEYIITDVMAPSLREEDILVLQPGYWYGKQVRLRLFDEQSRGQTTPECFEADLIYHALDVKFAGRVHFRAGRPLMQEVDAGMSADPADAGAP